MIPLKAALVLTSIQLILACSDSSGDQRRPANAPLKPAMTETQLLENSGRNIIFGVAERAKADNEILGGQIAELCSRITGEESYDDALANVRIAWKQAMSTHHRLEALPIGPAIDNGRKLVDNLYAWPYINPCGIDHQVVRLARTNEPNTNLNSSLKGLGALEYLIFETSLFTACNPKSASTKPILEWTQKPEREKMKDRCSYARNISIELIDLSAGLAKTWSPTEGDFTKTLVDGSRYPDAKGAINAMSDALFAVEALKDQRLGKVLGLHRDCTSESGKCPEMAEHPWSGFALTGIESQFKQFRILFTGDQGVGFDDYLEKMGRSEVSIDILRRTDAIIGALAVVKLTSSLQEQTAAMDLESCKQSTSSQRSVPVCALFRDIQALTRALKTDFLIARSLKAPPVFQGDND